MVYPTHRPITKKRQSIRQKHANGNNFADHNADFFTDNIFSNPKEKQFLKHKFTPRNIRIHNKYEKQYLNQYFLMLN